MELDELKQFLNHGIERAHQEKTPGEIAILLGKQTKSVAGKITKSLVFEILSGLLFCIICGVLAVFSTYSWVRIYFGIFAVICFLFVPVLYVIYRKTKILSTTVLPVKNNLQMIANLLKEYIKRYFQLTMALIPISILLATWLGYHDQNYYNASSQNILGESDTMHFIKVGAVVITYLVVFSFGAYYFTRWYLKKLYGNYIKQLEILIEELEEEIQ